MLQLGGSETDPVQPMGNHERKKMPKIINHDERREIIIRTALRLFAENGEKNTNLSLVAESCALSRGTVYQYFSSIQDIYLSAIKAVTDSALEKYKSSQWLDYDDIAGSLQRIANDCLEIADQYMQDIVNLIKIMPTAEFDIHKEIKRRTAKIRLLMIRALRAGVEKGLLEPCNPTEVYETMASLIGSYCFQNAFFPEYAARIKPLLKLYIDNLRKDEKKPAAGEPTSTH